MSVGTIISMLGLTIFLRWDYNPSVTASLILICLIFAFGDMLQYLWSLRV